MNPPTRVVVMSTHRGASTLVTDHGTEIRAGADLKSTGSTWGGYLTIDTENWDIVKNLWSGRIRLPNGTEGAFDRPNRETTPPNFDLPMFRIRIEGNGDAPF
jgi:hypothetical protein